MVTMLLYLLALAMIYLLPGPDMILLLQTGARHGRSLALTTALGLGMARACHVGLAALGLAALFKTAPWTFDTVRLLGAAYLLWIGVRMLRPGTLTALGADSESERVHRLNWRGALRQGLLTNLLNPKALLFCSVLLPQFIDPRAGAVGAQFLGLGVTLVVIGLLFDSCYALAGAWIGRWLDNSPRAQRVQQWLFGGLLIGFAARLAFIQQA
ncbi:LysE family translocator [Pseudomonas gingeri]|uniref:LysE family translocator n=1 Tax=Pseudomonas gingeri TaxID=117681 RepID=A0A7Y8CI44_9PSED|nr:LysE family translocator [Pseudomonas gingeri]NWA04096.1 LysE family translocator [Pseudomonas gingeri]NWA15940.1 LysE family translocator [Pseudomonas gingeri]NWA58324.1 LysE family translocator [Pseudomonas gingeri]NWA99342.1 LysE family translocator [Pseudomonas gingeri]NWB05873.1 LysE family translocator [Pseudomonas gingeri]